jgi:hypothetical protein
VERRRKPFDTAPLDRIGDELRLPSLSQSPPRLQGHAYRFKVVLPILSEKGEEIFTDYHLRLLYELFDRRFGGSLASASVAHPPWHGSYLPESGTESVKDYHTVLYVYARPIDAADRFFQILKSILKTAGLMAQDEVLIERAAVWLVEGAPLPRGRPSR